MNQPTRHPHRTHGPDHPVRYGILPLIILLSLVLPQRAQAQNQNREPYVQLVTPNSIVVRWNTATANRGAIEYRPVGSTSTPVRRTEATVLNVHELSADTFPDAGPALTPDTLYEYRVGSVGVKGVFTALYNAAFSDPRFRFRTAPEPGSAKLTRVWVLGDSGQGNANLNAATERFFNFNNGRPLDLILMMGDNAYENGTQADFHAAIFDTTDTDTQRLRQFMSGAALYPTIGNHELTLSVHQNIFTLPANPSAEHAETYFSFDYGNIHFVCLNSFLPPAQPINRHAAAYAGFTPGVGAGDPLDTWTAADQAGDSTMIAWLKNDLQQNDKDWTIAYWHHPPYARDSDFNSDSFPVAREMRWNACHVLEDYGVDLVLCGHSHNYQRSKLINGYYYGGTNDATRTPLNSQTSSVAQATGFIKDTGTGSTFGAADNVTGAYVKSGATAGPAPVAAGEQTRFSGEGTVYCVPGHAARAPLDAFGANGPHPVMLADNNTPGTAGVESTGSFDNFWGTGIIEVQGNRLDFKMIASTAPTGGGSTSFWVADNFTIIKKFKGRELPALTMRNGAYQNSIALGIAEENVVVGEVSNLGANLSNPDPGDPRLTASFNAAWEARSAFTYLPVEDRVTGIFSAWLEAGDDELAASGFSANRIVNGSAFLFTGFPLTPTSFVDGNIVSNIPGQMESIRGNFIAGTSYNYIATRWTAPGLAAVTLGTFPGGAISIGTGVNAEGRVIGYADDAGNVRGFRTSVSGGVSGAGIGLNCFPWKINTAGGVAGDFAGKAFLLRPADTAVVNTTFAAGGNLLGELAGFTGSSATGLNDWELAVGTSTKPTAPTAKGFYWANRKLMPLALLAGGGTGTALAGNAFTGVDVNNRGLVVVNVLLPDGTTHAHVLDPSPRP